MNRRGDEFVVTDFKEQIINQIMLIDRNIDNVSFRQHLDIIFSSYEIQKENYEITIYEGDVNENLIKRFLINKTVSGCTKRTVNAYKSALIYFSNSINKLLTDVTSDDIRYFIAQKSINDKVSRETQRNYFRCISSFYTWLQKEEILLKNPISKVECPKKEKKKKHAFTEIELETMRNSIDDLRTRAIFELMLSTWCRVSEIVGINISDINADGSIEVLGKGQKTRKVFLNAKAKIAIEEYIKSRDDFEIPLFVAKDKPHERLKMSGIEIIIRNLGRKCGIENVHPHRFRRTGATFALRAGMPIQDVSKILGHESIDTTQIYLDIDEKEVERSHEKYVR